MKNRLWTASLWLPGRTVDARRINTDGILFDLPLYLVEGSDPHDGPGGTSRVGDVTSIWIQHGAPLAWGSTDCLSPGTYRAAPYFTDATVEFDESTQTLVMVTATMASVMIFDGPLAYPSCSLTVHDTDWIP